MHKRFLCLLLTVVLLLSMIPFFALPSMAASNMKTSEKCIEILKAMEGFSEHPFYDHGQYSVGYGSACEKDDYPNGITEEEADVLLREYLTEMEEDVNKFATRYDIIFSQNQFDAVMLFTYNCGTNWVNSDGTFREAVIENKTGNSFIYAITLWSNASSQLNLGLVNRRLAEANIYLNGVYDLDSPSNYTYVIYDNNEGVGQARVQGYDCNLSAYVQSVPTREGYTFLGWYSAAEGGSWITELTEANAEQTLYAHWQGEDVKPTVGTPASYQIPAANLLSLEFYDAPNGKVINSLNQSTMAYVEADYVDAKGLKWGRIANGRWVKLGAPRIGTCDETEDTVGVEATVTGDYVNVRSGPGTGFTVVAGVVQGDKIFVTRAVTVDGTLWGKVRGGWLCLEYTDYTGGLTPSDPDPENPEDNPATGEPIATGTVNTTGLNIRSTAGTNGYLMGCYRYGDRVEIFEKTMVGSTPWGRTDKGWICLSFVKLDGTKDEPEKETTAPTEAETTEPETTVPETTVPETTVPETTVPETEATEPENKPEAPQGIPATVTSKGGLNIRTGPGTKNGSVGSYSSGEKIHILEQKLVDGVSWGRTDKGWVCMQYVRLSDSWSNENGVYGVVICNGTLNIRAGAGVGYAPVGNYTPGTRILIYEQAAVSGRKWGRTDKGWICMDYVRLEASAAGSDKPANNQPEDTADPTVPSEKPEQQPEENVNAITGSVSAGVLNVRATPGTGGTIVGNFRKGDRVKILEQKQVNGTAWGRTDKGWISLAYVVLDNAGNNQTATGTKGVITASVLCIRMGPGTGNAVIGSYKQGQSVVVLETTRVGTTVWGRTDLGWICMKYVK